jgi:predicted DNA-binding transcriptional regulator AlpA
MKIRGCSPNFKLLFLLRYVAKSGIIAAYQPTISGCKMSNIEFLLENIVRRLSHLETAIRLSQSAPVAEPPTEKRKPISPNLTKGAMIGANTVREMCGNISDMTIHRWLNDPDLGFPRPTYIGKRRYWRRDDIDAWLTSLHGNSRG